MNTNYNKRTAVILLNLGGPDTPKAVRPFLFNLFNDPAIIRVVKPLRYLIAQMISRLRQREAQSIYAHIGGGSPLLLNTEQQAQALQVAIDRSLTAVSNVDQATINQLNVNDYRVFVCMRYWHPRASAVMQQVADYQPDNIVVLPLYPQFSTTTTQSSFDDWRQNLSAELSSIPHRFVGCYPCHPAFIQAYVKLIQDCLPDATAGAYRILFTAHGLPQRYVDEGDPYAWQVQQTVGAIVDQLEPEQSDWKICYQSRVGPVQWLKPYADQEVIAAAKQKLGIVMVPISFVSEHSETLVELDIQYRQLARDHGAPYYIRVPTVSCHPDFIEALRRLILNDDQPAQHCPVEFNDCYCRKSKNV